MLYAHAITGSAEAAHFLSLSGPSAAPGIVASIMNIKLQTYLRFNETYPPVLEDSCRGLLRALKISLLLGTRTTVFPVLTMCKLFQPYSQDCQLPTDFIHSELLWVVYAFIQAAEEPRTSHISILRRSGRLGWTIPRLLQLGYACHPTIELRRRKCVLTFISFT